jgi:hypothetical protein
LKPAESTGTELFTVAAEKLNNGKYTIKSTALFLNECSPTSITNNSLLIWQQN